MVAGKLYRGFEVLKERKGLHAYMNSMAETEDCIRRASHRSHRSRTVRDTPALQCAGAKVQQLDAITFLPASPPRHVLPCRICLRQRPRLGVAVIWRRVREMSAQELCPCERRAVLSMMQIAISIRLHRHQSKSSLAQLTFFAILFLVSISCIQAAPTSRSLSSFTLRGFHIRGRRRLQPRVQSSRIRRCIPSGSRIVFAVSPAVRCPCFARFTVHSSSPASSRTELDFLIVRNNDAAELRYRYNKPSVRTDTVRYVRKYSVLGARTQRVHTRRRGEQSGRNSADAHGTVHTTPPVAVYNGPSFEIAEEGYFALVVRTSAPQQDCAAAVSYVLERTPAQCPVRLGDDGGGREKRAVARVLNAKKMKAKEISIGDTSARVQTHIVGGTKVDKLHQSMMVAFVRFGQFFCSGSLISRNTVLTAAHCRITDYDVAYVGGDTVFSGTAVRIRSVRSHEKYMSKQKDSPYDLALVTLKNAVEGSSAEPILLNSASATPKELAYVRASGYGRLAEKWTGTGAPSLRKVDLPVIPTRECEETLLDRAVKLRTPLNEALQLCAGYADGACDACQGDSGGPLAVLDPTGRPIQVGIVSFGIGCARESMPGVYTRIAAFSEWIRKHVPDAKFSSAGRNVLAESLFSNVSENAPRAGAGSDGIAGATSARTSLSGQRQRIALYSIPSAIGGLLIVSLLLFFIFCRTRKQSPYNRDAVAGYNDVSDDATGLPSSEAGAREALSSPPTASSDIHNVPPPGERHRLPASAAYQQHHHHREAYAYEDEREIDEDEDEEQEDTHRERGRRRRSRRRPLSPEPRVAEPLPIPKEEFHKNGSKARARRDGGHRWRRGDNVEDDHVPGASRLTLEMPDEEEIARYAQKYKRKSTSAYVEDTQQRRFEGLHDDEFSRPQSPEIAFDPPEVRHREEEQEGEEEDRQKRTKQKAKKRSSGKPWTRTRQRETERDLSASPSVPPAPAPPGYEEVRGGTGLGTAAERRRMRKELRRRDEERQDEIKREELAGTQTSHAQPAGYPGRRSDRERKRAEEQQRRRGKAPKWNTTATAARAAEAQHHVVDEEVVSESAATSVTSGSERLQRMVRALRKPLLDIPSIVPEGARPRSAGFSEDMATQSSRYEHAPARVQQQQMRFVHGQRGKKRASAREEDDEREARTAAPRQQREDVVRHVRLPSFTSSDYAM